MEVMGMAASFSAKVHEKVVKVEDNGNFVVESTQTEGKVKFGDQEMDAPSSGASTSKFTPNGELVELTGEDTSEDSYRLAALSGIITANGKSYKVGDKISWEIKPEKRNGNTKGAGTATVKAVESVSGTECVVLEVSYKETTGSEPAESNGTVWLSTKDNAPMKFEGTYKNAPFPGAPGPITAKIKMERI